MAPQKPGIPKGTRDFGPVETSRRNYIFDTIRKVFRQHGYIQIETPAMENLDTLLGKYGEEGDKLLFRILDSGEFFEGVKSHFISDNNSFIISDLLLKMYKKLLREIVYTYDFKFTTNKEYILSYLERYLNEFSIEDPQVDKWTLSFFVNHIKENERMKRMADFIAKFIEKCHIDDLITNSELEQIFDNYLLKDLHFIFVRKNLVEKYFIFEKFRITNSNDISKLISEKGLRYDLTVPFARFVVQHQHEIEFPFKRFQIQPVWRADRPQKGRYREFYQCDADVIGSNSLLNEADLLTLADEVFAGLGLRVKIKLNNRKVLAGLAEYIGHPDKITDITVAIDKLEKIGLEAVNQELQMKGISVTGIYKLEPLFALHGTNAEKLDALERMLKDIPVAMKGIEEMRTLFALLGATRMASEIEFDLSLARGLNYYTGTIIEVKALDVQIGSICGGGRYDDLTGIFGLKNISGVGISFGADRIYDVIDQLNLFPEDTSRSSTVILANFGVSESQFCLGVLDRLRKAGIAAELYPDAVKLGKQFAYADSRKIPYVAIIGENEMAAGKLTLKDLKSGEQREMTVEEAVGVLKTSVSQ